MNCISSIWLALKSSSKGAILKGEGLKGEGKKTVASHLLNWISWSFNQGIKWSNNLLLLECKPWNSKLVPNRRRSGKIWKFCTPQRFSYSANIDIKSLELFIFFWAKKFRSNFWNTETWLDDFHFHLFGPSAMEGSTSWKVYWFMFLRSKSMLMKVSGNL